MIIKNKLTRETLDIPYSEFRKMFGKEIRVAFESYHQSQLNKYFYKFRDNKSLKYDFYFNLQWNFNHYLTPMEYYYYTIIEKSGLV